MKVLTATGWTECQIEFDCQMPIQFGGVKLAPCPELESFVERTLHRELQYLFVETEHTQTILVSSFIDDYGEEDFYGFQAALTPEEAITYAKLMS